MLFLTAPEGLPAFRRQRLAADLQEVLGGPVRFAIDSLYLLAVDTLPDDARGRRLCQLLGADPLQGPPDGLVILPRRGTRSAWSSKAGDILARCGFESVGRIERGLRYRFESPAAGDLGPEALARLHDRMTESAVLDPDDLAHWFDEPPPEPLGRVELGTDPMAALATANRTLGLALNDDEMAYLAAAYRDLGRSPTDAELMMFAQANSEHCRHKIFNATWTVDGHDRPGSLFGMIRETHRRHPNGTLVAYDDNAAVLEGYPGTLLATRLDAPGWMELDRRLHVQIKVETHNHPTAISPDPGAATGAGGEIRDEAATGRGARPVAGLTGFTVSDLEIPDFRQPWEQSPPPPGRLANAREIMLEGPIGAARFNNEFGRPNLGGYFRTFAGTFGGRLWGYHKPIMIAGGAGTIAAGQTEKNALSAGDAIIVLGGPAMLIGLGGGAASSMAAGQSSEDLDYASVQRANPEMQRRCQEVIDRCWAEGDDNPVASIHDVGAGGLSNAVPELLHDGGVGAELELREIPSADGSLSPMAIWCNEAQERYVLAVPNDRLERFRRICIRERCPFAVLGRATDDGRLRLNDRRGDQEPVDLSLDVLFGKTPAMHRDVESGSLTPSSGTDCGLGLDEALDRLLQVPAVGSKQFLITIGDRTVGGLSARDQMVGPWQVPVADCAVTLTDYRHFTGTAMAMGERTPLAVWNAPASGRMAVAEALTNLAGVAGADLHRVRLSANWMAAAGAPGQDAALRATVEAVTGEFLDALGISIPVGKDSLSMQTRWHDGSGEQTMLAPVSLIVSAFVPVPDVRRVVTPQLAAEADTVLVLAGPATTRLGGSALAQASGRELGEVPDVDDVAGLRGMLEAVAELLDADRLLAVHDRSDGGLVGAALEMAFAGRRGLDLEIPDGADPLAWLFAEEYGVVMQVRRGDLERVQSAFADRGLTSMVTVAGVPVEGDRMTVRQAGRVISERAMANLMRLWAGTSYRMQRLRDHPDCVDQEFAALAEYHRPGLTPRLTFDPESAPALAGTARPRVAILREQGVNGQREMAMAFLAAGFEPVDVHMSDLESGRVALADFRGLVACGGFSFGDVLGAGQGWARSILFNDRLRGMFAEFLGREDCFALGVCNGCQMFSALREIIPGTDHWPDFVHNRSRQFEARLSLVEIRESPSLFFAGMAGSRLPVATAHGEGRADFGERDPTAAVVALRYVTADGRPAESYPDNPNGSPGGVTGLCNSDGRVTILMPHPERLLRTVNFSWAPPEWGERSPWARMFDNARAWCDGNRKR